MLIREAKHKDLPFILEIMNDAILTTTSIYDYKERNDEFVQTWFNNKRTDNMPIFVYDIDNQAVAFGSYGIFRAWDAYKFSVEHSIYVHKNFQGQGIGKKLLSALIEVATKDGYHTMIAGIDAANQKSYDFHKQFDFTEVGRFKEVGYKFDKWLDLIFMQRMLNNDEV
jgi:L-amino acid N-acyltransferase